MEVGFIFYLLFIHWIADFVFQDEQWALGKSKSLKSLLKHTLTYSGILAIAFFPFLGTNTIYFVLLNFAFHTTTDYVTSRIVARRFKQKYLGGVIPNLGAFTVIGFDQVLHYIILFVTLQYYL